MDARLLAEIMDGIEERLKPLMEAIGNLGKCRGCGATIYWIKHRNGVDCPYTPSGLNHFIDCPARTNFRKAKQNG